MNQANNAHSGSEKKVAYIVGTHYSGVTRLPNMWTATEFLRGIMDGGLPLNYVWIAGQGLNAVELSILRLCKPYRSEIRFSYYEEEAILNKNQTSALSRYDFTKNIFAKMFHALMMLVHAAEKPANHIIH